MQIKLGHDQGMTMDSVLENLKKIANLPRHLISDGYDEGLAIIGRIAKERGLNFKVHSYPTGYDCGTWIIPEKWTLISAQMKDINGNVLLDSETNPLACMSYSLPFEGRVSRGELLNHLYTCSYQPEATPFVFKYYKRDWGLCCSQKLKDSLRDEEYYVSINAEFSDGHLKVGEIIVEGDYEESFIIASHLCHPYMVNDGPIGVFPTMEILERLKNNHPHYTYRQLIVPENIGSAAWLSSNVNLIPKLRGGLFVEMIGTDLPLRLHRSFRGDTLVDQLFENVVREHSATAVIDDFVYANDERQFNGPGVDVPMLGLNRSWMTREQQFFRAFPHYHTSDDDMAHINIQNLAEAVKMLEEIVTSFDQYLVIPVPHFRGEPFLHRYGKHIAYEEMEQYKKSNLMMDILFMCGRELTIFEIGKALDVSPEIVGQILEGFVDNGLVSYKPI